MSLLRIKLPEYCPKASESVEEAVGIIKHLLKYKKAYWYKKNVYFDPLTFSRFGKLYGLDMSKWPSKKKRFHLDTYPGMQWNLGDFILWHGYRKGDKYYWHTAIGKGRPSWNVQDPSMISKHFHETLSIYCGGVDNLYRHHDYTLAILESVRKYPMARFWLHCQYLTVNGQKMSKSKGNILYIDSLKKRGFSNAEIRFFLTYGQYREKINYSDRQICLAVDKLRDLRNRIGTIEKRSKKRYATRHLSSKGKTKCLQMKRIFSDHMDNDLNVRNAFDGVSSIILGLDIDNLGPADALLMIKTLMEIDEVFKFLF
jgi:cysteinyl-tRNA synthetase